MLTTRTGMPNGFKSYNWVRILVDRITLCPSLKYALVFVCCPASYPSAVPHRIPSDFVFSAEAP